MDAGLVVPVVVGLFVAFVAYKIVKAKKSGSGGSGGGSFRSPGNKYDPK